MGDQLTEDDPPKESPTISEIFHEAFPHYLLMGMTPEQYWDGDSWMVKGYRKAYKMRKDQEYKEADARAWTEGMYIRNALQSVYLMVNGFVPKGVEAIPYPSKPYSVSEEEKKQEEKRKKNEEEIVKRNMALFHAMAAKFNKNFERRKKEQDKTV